MKSIFILLYPFLFWECHNGVESMPMPSGNLDPCEGCEAIYESPIPHAQLPHVDTLPDFFEAGPKMLVYGVVYKKDGKTPAPGVVIYAYHTDQEGLYSKGKGTEWGKRHGYIRSWVKSNHKGEYKMFTLRPAPYPSSDAAAHIHMTIKEPEKKEYYVDEIMFNDDKSEEIKNHKFPERGGSGIISVKMKDGIQLAERNIYLGKNIPGYK
jgi:protocatechuate 3,4-dioxygenase, beta subunit